MRVWEAAAIVVAALAVVSVVACDAVGSVRVPVLYANESAEDLGVRVTDDGGAGSSTTASYRLGARSRAVLADQAFFGAEGSRRSVSPSDTSRAPACWATIPLPPICVSW